MRTIKTINTFTLIIPLLVFILLSTSCNRDTTDKVAETAGTQSREKVSVENKNIEDWSLKLLQDLQSRRDYIEGIDGEYEGEFSLRDQEYGLKIIIASTFPIFIPDRERRIEEIVFELNNLNINVQIIQWPLRSNHVSTGCIFDKVRPDYEKGIIDVFSKSCGVSYKIELASSEENLGERGELSARLMNSTLKEVNTLKIKMQSNSISKRTELIVERTR